MNGEAPIGYNAIKALKKETKILIPDLLALARDNDPFFTGTPAHIEKAQWFAEVWEQIGATQFHLRRVHYVVLSRGDLHPHGMQYENTEACTKYLNDAARFARHLGLVDALELADHRNAAPYLHDDPPSEAPWCELDPFELFLPRIPTQIVPQVDLGAPVPQVTGYDYSRGDQPVRIVVGIEKSTMNDVLLPLCAALGIELMTGVGFQSITRVVQMTERVVHHGKPARVFYISDFDPAGDSMPVAVARQMEFRLAVTKADGVDVKLTPLALTRQQVVEHELPRIPVKDSDKRKAKFEDRHGEGAVELDALEALHPGLLAVLVREAVAPYQDPSFADRLAVADEHVREVVVEQWAETIRNETRELACLQDEAERIARVYEGRLRDLDWELQRELRPIRKRLKVVSHAMQVAAKGFDAELPDRPEPEIDLPDETDWLYSSHRTYLEQLAAYKAHQQPEAR